MDSVDAFLFRQRYDSRNVQIGFHGTLGGANLIGFVSLKAMQRQPVFLRIDGHRAQAKLIGGAENAYGDFAAIGGEKLANWFGLLHLRGDQCVARNSTLFHGGDATE